VANIIAEIRRRSSQNGGMFQPLLIKTAFKKGPYSELVGSLLREDSFECNMAGFLESVSRAVVIPK
jgi:hypothetical protein